MDAGSPSPGERLLYVLGQMYRLHHQGESAVEPAKFDVSDLAVIIGVVRDIEFITESESGGGRSFHFSTDEVLVVDLSQQFPWTLLTAEEWAWSQELADLVDAGDANPDVDPPTGPSST